MRTFVFTLLAIALSMGIQRALGFVPSTFAVSIHGLLAGFIFLLPMIGTAVLAYAMRIPHFIYVYILVVLSPFVAAILGILFSVGILNERLYFP